LEEKSLAGTVDFDEIVKGYSRLSSTQKDNLKILIAFGGAKLSNWKGIKYADIECLIQDSKDGTYGNDNCYEYKNADANMGKAETLKNFLRFASNDIISSKRNYLIFWNHGGAYNGLCYDSNYNFDQLTLDELEQSLKETLTKKVDVIGMDACLMSNMEVLKSIKNYGDFLLASEDSEPGHGWDYEDVIYIIGQGENESLNSIGKKLVDSFIDSPKHIGTQNKTLSFLKLSETDNVISKIDAVTDRLDADNDFKSIGLSSYNAQKFAISDANRDGISMDLKSFSNRLGVEKSTIKSFTDSLSAAIDKLVIYSKAQDPDIYGITIYQPLDSHDWSSYKNLSYITSQSWYNLLSNFTVTKGNDIQKPVIQSEESCKVAGSEGFCLNITDNIALKNVDSYGLMPYGDDYMLLYSEILKTTSSGTYFLSKFDDNWIYLCDGDDKNRCIFPSAFELESTESDTSFYMALGQYNGEDVTFFIKITSYNIELWAILDSPSSYSSKVQYQVKQGDKVRFDYIGFKDSGDIFTIKGDSITFKQKPTWSKQSFNVNLGYFAMAEDFNDNSVLSQTHLTGSQSQTSTDTIDTSSSQSRLSYLNGKTLLLNYDYYGTSYSESISFSEAPFYSSEVGRYTIKGVRDNSSYIYCFSDEQASDHVIINGVSYMYDCPDFFSDGSRDLFAFNINSDLSISGYYEYVQSGLNAYNEILDPDSVLVSSKVE
jgi:hypothetical protein